MHLKFFNDRRVLLLFAILRPLCLHRTLVLSLLSRSECVSAVSIIIVLPWGLVLLEVLAFPALFQELLKLQVGFSAYIF